MPIEQRTPTEVDYAGRYAFIGPDGTRARRLLPDNTYPLRAADGRTFAQHNPEGAYRHELEDRRAYDARMRQWRREQEESGFLARLFGRR